MRGKMDCYGLTDVGQVREVNEDQFLIADLSKSMLVHQTSLGHEDHTRLFGGSQGQLLLVADGMGGQAAGQQASAIAVQTLERYVLNAMPWFFRLQESLEDDHRDELKVALEACQRGIEAAAEASPARRGMGTTLTMAYVVWPRLYVVHVGTSRCYLFRRPRTRSRWRRTPWSTQPWRKGATRATLVPARCPRRKRLLGRFGSGSNSPVSPRPPQHGED